MEVSDDRNANRASATQDAEETVIYIMVFPTSPESISSFSQGLAFRLSASTTAREANIHPTSSPHIAMPPESNNK